MKLDLDQAEVEAIFSILGEMPAKAGTFPLMLKIKEQFEAQVVPVQAVPDIEEAA